VQEEQSYALHSLSLPPHTTNYTHGQNVFLFFVHEPPYATTTYSKQHALMY